jgi:hypothetical protein
VTAQELRTLETHDITVCSRSDEALLETSVLARDIESNLAEVVQPLCRTLYERFDVTGLTVARIANEIERFQQSRLR